MSDHKSTWQWRAARTPGKKLPQKQKSTSAYTRTLQEHYLRFDPAACEPFVQLFDMYTDIYWHLAAVELWVPSLLPVLFLQPATTLLTTFSRFKAKLKPSLRVEAFAGVTLFSHRQVLLVFVRAASELKRRCRLHSWDSGVLSVFIPFIAIHSFLKENCAQKMNYF